MVLGYDLGALSAATQSLRSQFSLSPPAFGLTISASLWGTVVGSLVAGYFADRWGRRMLIAACALAYLLAAVALALCDQTDWGVVLILRILCGITIGGFTVGCPLYLAEIAPPERRGRFVAWFQVQVGIGVIMGFAAGLVFAKMMPPSLYWRACFGVGAIPPLILLCFIRRMPGEAKWLSPPGGVQEVDSEGPLATAEFYTSVGSDRTPRLFRRAHLRPLLLATSIALFNQLSGVNILLLYLLDVLSNTGIDLVRSHRYTLILAGLNLATTVCGMTLVDKVGRKALLVTGAAGMSLCLFVLSGRLHVMTPLNLLLLLVAYNTCFAFSQGTVIWVYLSELFPLKVRAKGQSYGASVLWVANAALVSLYPTLQRLGHGMVFRFFGTIMLVQVLVVFFWYPETKGIRIEQGV
jgi:SP family arabinose:H+ symporter-like MFS transporter